MSRKSERLVNLTIALLATKRYLTKSEIFRTVDGYEGSQETMERMFERDKDDLRNLGIVIEVGSFDPLFEDEAGYRILNSKYRFQLGELTSQQIALLSLAAQAWKGAALNASAQSALIKLKSIGIESDFSNLPALAPHHLAREYEISRIVKAIASRSRISFLYTNAQMNVEEREIDAYGVGSAQGFWYFVGFDKKRDGIRTFRCDRVVGEITIASKRETYEVPPHFSIASHIEPKIDSQMARLKIRIGCAYDLRSKGVLVSGEEESVLIDWDLFEVPFNDLENFSREILWHQDNIFVESPRELRDKVISHLQKAASINE